MKQSAIRAFQKKIRDFYKTHERKMPWRETRDPYRIVVSEIMLQQTQVSRVLPKYAEFIRKFPNFRALANAPLRDVLKVWQGLGYNRRAVALHRIAYIVTHEYKGKLSGDPEKLSKLPGIGSVTAAGIAAFAFDTPSIYIDTNVRRVFLHEFFPGRKAGDEEIAPLVAATLDRRDPRHWYYALLDYGAWLPKIAGNANRRHAAYRKQSKFEGSHRQFRGAVLRLRLTHPKMTRHAMAKRLGKTLSDIRLMMAELRREGLAI